MNDNYQSQIIPPTTPSITPMPAPASPKKSWIWIVAILAIVGALFFAYYVYYDYGNIDYGNSPAAAPNRAVTRTGVSVKETAAVEQDLQSVSLDSLDSELKDIQKELGK